MSTEIEFEDRIEFTVTREDPQEEAASEDEASPESEAGASGTEEEREEE